ncbi:MAG: recQ 2 [Eubacterium sp.]|nr:recQ 2 [Eubacterium sp.]
MQKKQILKEYFGYDSFREGQEKLIDFILSGRDVLGIMPTGAGKSLCFQVPALLFKGITLVISPLISLMKDQVQSLIASGIPAAFINSTLSNNQIARALENAKSGKYKIIYVAPERLDTNEFYEFSLNSDISMVTIDEAHCVSQWGQNFRPGYLKISEFIDKLSKRPVVSAFTATATKEVKDDIVSLLKLNNPFELVTGFNRENLYFGVQKPVDKYKAVLKYLKENPSKSGIIYCSTRKTVEEVCDKLIEDKFNATRYHAGLTENERTQNQDDFLYDRRAVMVATNAFGMGIDKSNVAFVIHYNMPKNLESYYQEAGRSGRDGSAADCIMLYGGQDVVTNQLLIDSSNENSELDFENSEKVKEKDRERLKQITYFCHSTDCLRKYILSYFGDAAADTCGNCSNCNTTFEEVDITEDAQKIMSCITRMNERYGIKMVIDTLRGSKSEKVLKFGLDKLKTYGIMAGIQEKQIRDIINYLVLNEYLALTNTEFPQVKLTQKSRNVMYDNEKLMMKTLIEQQPEIRKTKTRVAVNNALLAKLKELRFKLAQQKNVPAFVIFSDSTLIDMCSKMPANADEFLQVSGVGKIKLEAYGKEFLELIASYSNPEKPEAAEKEYTFDEVCTLIREQLELSKEPVTISIFADKVNYLLLQNNFQKVSAIKIADYLVSEGYLEIERADGKNTKVATEKGQEAGVVTVIKNRENYESYKQNLYYIEAQRLLANNIEHILKYVYKVG